MARYTGPRTRISRRFGIPLFGPDKYLERRNYGPGVHGPKSRRKHTDYGLGLIEKQKLRYFYGLMERQFRGVYERALAAAASPASKCCKSWKRAWTTWFIIWALPSPAPPPAKWSVTATSRSTDARSTSPPTRLKVNDTMEVRESNVSRQLATKNLELSTSKVVPDWLSLNKEAFKGVVMRIPTRDEIQPIANEQAVVEFYSR
jgi:small subunit ribosomal protein S4